MASTERNMRRPSAAELATARQFLRTCSAATLESMLAELAPSVRSGEAGVWTWLAVDELRAELAVRGSGAGRAV